MGQACSLLCHSDPSVNLLIPPLMTFRARDFHPPVCTGSEYMFVFFDGLNLQGVMPRVFASTTVLVIRDCASDFVRHAVNYARFPQVHSIYFMTGVAITGLFASWDAAGVVRPSAVFNPTSWKKSQLRDLHPAQIEHFPQMDDWLVKSCAYFRQVYPNDRSLIVDG